MEKILEKLHSIFVTEKYWKAAGAAAGAAADVAAELTEEKERNCDEETQVEFIKAFHTFFTNTKTIMSETNSELVKEIENEFDNLELRNNNKLLKLIDLWEQYSERVQESPSMELIKGAMVMGDERTV